MDTQNGAATNWTAQGFATPAIAAGATPAWADTANTTGGVESKLQMGNQILGQILQVVQGWFPRSTGTFTMSATASKVVTDANVKTTSYISSPTPTNAAAATLMGSAKSLYVTAATGSFTVSTANGGNAVGTETFSYAVFTPN